MKSVWSGTSRLPTKSRFQGIELQVFQNQRRYWSYSKSLLRVTDYFILFSWLEAVLIRNKTLTFADDMMQIKIRKSKCETGAKTLMDSDQISRNLLLVVSQEVLNWVIRYWGHDDELVVKFIPYLDWYFYRR